MPSHWSIFIRDVYIVFNGMGMEYRLKRQAGASNCGWVNWMLDWETNDVGLWVLFLEIFFFFINLPPKTILSPKNRSVKVSLEFFFF